MSSTKKNGEVLGRVKKYGDEHNQKINYEFRRITKNSMM